MDCPTEDAAQKNRSDRAIGGTLVRMTPVCSTLPAFVVFGNLAESGLICGRLDAWHLTHHDTSWPFAIHRGHLLGHPSPGKLPRALISGLPSASQQTGIRNKLIDRRCHGLSVTGSEKCDRLRLSALSGQQVWKQQRPVHKPWLQRLRGQSPQKGLEKMANLTARSQSYCW